jgi:hypothetical protein
LIAAAAVVDPCSASECLVNRDDRRRRDAEPLGGGRSRGLCEILLDNECPGAGDVVVDIYVDSDFSAAGEQIAESGSSSR